MHQGILACMELSRHDANTAGALLVMCAALVVGPSTVQAQTSTSPAKRQASDFQAVFLDGNYATPVRWNLGAALFFSHDDIKNSDGGSGLIVGGSVGAGGTQVWAGKALLGDVGNVDFRAVVTRTWDNPRGASPNSTYVGGEVGWGLGVRLSVGYAKRIRGPSTGDGHIVTWGVGLEIPVWR
jgi:hypothetical protein